MCVSHSSCGANSLPYDSSTWVYGDASIECARYDTYICRVAGPPQTVFIRGRFYQSTFDSPAAVNGTLAILSYSPNDTTIPAGNDVTQLALPTANPSISPMYANNIDPYTIPPDPPFRLPKPDHVMQIDLRFFDNSTGVNLAHLNQSAWYWPNMSNPNDPTLAELAIAGTPIPRNANIIYLELGKVYQVS